MRYIVDTDALCKCLNFLTTIDINDHEYVALENVKRFIDCFPKEAFDIPIPILSEPGICEKEETC